MEVVAYLPPSLRHTLHAAVGRAHSVRDAEDWRTVGRFVRRSPVDAIVVDPTLGGPVGVTVIAELARRHAALPIVVYATLDASSARAIAALSDAGVREVVLAGVDDAPAHFLDAVERQPCVRLAEAVIDRIEPALDALPLGLSAAVRRMLLCSGEVANASELATMAGMPRRTLYRTCESAGFASPSLMVRAARLLHAYAHLRDADRSAGDVVDRLGYSSRQLFWRHVWETFDMRPTDLRRDLKPDEFVRRLSSAIWSGPAVVAQGHA